MEGALIVSAALLILGLGVLVGRYLLPSISRVARYQIETARGEVARVSDNLIRGEAKNRELAREVESLRIEAARQSEREASLALAVKKQDEHIEALERARHDASSEIVSLTAETSKLREQSAGQHSRISELTQDCEQLKQQIEEAAQRGREVDGALSEARASLSASREREEALNRQVNEQPIQEARQFEKMKFEFENLANLFLKQAGLELTENSHKELDALLSPLMLRLKDMEGHLDIEKRDMVSLKTEIKQVVEATQIIGNKADGLANALRNDSQRRGRWGELALERILEAAGLTEGRDYVTQGRGLGLRNDDGSIQRPDVIVNLPGGRCFVIDSKVSLIGYEQLLEANADDLSAARARFVRDVKVHIDALASKEYQQNPTLQAHESVLMFVPIEGAISAALTADPELFRYGWDRSVILVGPANLMMAMQSTAAIWRFEDQNQNAKEIAALAAQLCDKITSSLEDMQTAAGKMKDATEAHTTALKRLSSGKGNVLSLGNRIRTLGVSPRKPSPVVIIDGVTLSGDDDEGAGVELVAEQSSLPPVAAAD